MHIIKFADKEDQMALREFIDRHWRKDHIFVQSKELFDWQHYDQKNDRYNFVIGVEKATNNLHGILGFIPLAQFDVEIDRSRLCWMAIWKVCDEARGQRLGRRLMDFLEETVQPKIISTVGASAMTVPMYEAKGYQIGELEQFYGLNSNVHEYRLATVPEGAGHMTISGDSAVKLIEISEEDVLNETSECFSQQQAYPVKTPRYIVNRYLRHPMYDYQAYAVRKGTRTIGLVVLRKCYAENSCALRVIDFIGPSVALHGLADEWMRLMVESSAEYVDFYCAGIPAEDLELSGLRNAEADNVILPNYFEPYEPQKVQIRYMSSAKGQFRIVKGDSDQDRPNML